MNILKGLAVDLMGEDFTNGGVTSGKSRAVLVGPGIPEIFSPSEDSPALLLVPGYGSRTFMAVPVKQPADALGPMFGGRFIYSSDSRFPSDQPIHVHDRFESQELYNLLSS